MALPISGANSTPPVAFPQKGQAPPQPEDKNKKEASLATAGDSNGVRNHPDTYFEPKGFEMPKAGQTDSVMPESLPPKTKVTYSDLSQKLKANPKVNYIEIDRKDLNQGLSEFLNQYKEALDAKPELREKLAQTPAGQNLLDALDAAAKGELGTDAIIKLQTFIVASGEDIHTSNSATGIDGDYGPRTHAGLQQAFAKLLDHPDQAIQSFDQNYAQAIQYANDQRTDRQDMGNNFIPGQTDYSEPVTSDMTPIAPTGTGADLVAAARQSQPHMARVLAQLQAADGRPHYRCYQGVKDALNRLQPPIDLTGGSAYMAADQLRSRYADRFSDIRSMDPNAASTKAFLRNLPPGAIVVWGRNDSASLRAANPNNGYSHGHISIALGGGKEYSDRYRSQITNNDHRYGSVTIFMPK